MVLIRAFVFLSLCNSVARCVECSQDELSTALSLFNTTEMRENIFQCTGNEPGDANGAPEITKEMCVNSFCHKTLQALDPTVIPDCTAPGSDVTLRNQFATIFQAFKARWDTLCGAGTSLTLNYLLILISLSLWAFNS